MEMKTLIYPGAGYDEEIMNYLNYDNYIFYDTLPKAQHYKEGQAGYKYTKNEEVFLKKLKKEFGNYKIIRENELYFKKHKLTYFINTDANLIKTLPEGDILIRGYMPWNWDYSNRNVMICCDTVNDLGIENVIHFHDENDFCSLDDEEEESDEEEED